jgi:hypothetical protein
LDWKFGRGSGEDYVYVREIKWWGGEGSFGWGWFVVGRWGGSRGGMWVVEVE